MWALNGGDRLPQLSFICACFVKKKKGFLVALVKKGKNKGLDFESLAVGK